MGCASKRKFLLLLKASLPSIVILTLFQNCGSFEAEDGKELPVFTFDQFSDADKSFVWQNSNIKADFGDLVFSSTRGALRTTLGSISVTRSGFLTTKSGGMRAVDKSSNGNIGYLRFRYRGEAEEVRRLASGAIRQQIGLKLRSQNTCNLLYVMWRIYPTEQLFVSRKENRGESRHSECGAGGYTNLYRVPLSNFGVTARSFETKHLAAEIVNNQQLEILIDNKHEISLPLDGATRSFLRRTRGDAGLRSDNVSAIFKFKIER